MARSGKITTSQRMSLMGHIQELQRRLVISALFLIVAGSSAYAFKDQIITTLLQPLGGQKLMYLNPAGGFSFILMVSIYTGIALSAPLLLHQLYCFVRPALSKSVQKKSIQVLLSSSLLLISGVLFGYFFAIPGALQFLQEFAGEYVNASLTADAYLQFIVAYTLGLGLVFQLPLLLMLIHWIKPLTPGGLMKSERWIIVLSFVAAAIITPTPDPLNQTIIALPIILVYQLGVIAVLINIYKAKRKNKLNTAKQPVAPTAQPVTPKSDIPTPAVPQTASSLVQKPNTSVIPPRSLSHQPSRAVRSMDGIRRSQPVGARRTTAPLSAPQQRVVSASRYQPLRDPSSAVNLPATRRHSPQFAIDGISPSLQLVR